MNKTKSGAPLSYQRFLNEARNMLDAGIDTGKSEEAKYLKRVIFRQTEIDIDDNFYGACLLLWLQGFVFSDELRGMTESLSEKKDETN